MRLQLGSLWARKRLQPLIAALLALLAGLASNAVDGERLNIVAFPLLGMLVWNVAVYLSLLAASVRRLMSGRQADRRPPGWIT